MFNSNLTIPQAPVPNSPVQEQYGSLSIALESLRNQLYALCARIEPVLLPTPPSPAATTTAGHARLTAVEAASPLVNQLAGLVEVVHGMSREIDSALSRLEV
jgi:hypothetical protein